MSHPRRFMVGIGGTSGTIHGVRIRAGGRPDGGPPAVGAIG
ncbi:hypothetical protein [Arenibaculum sp.]|nr:hypothetical protein [Arenibaculum sp.]